MKTLPISKPKLMMILILGMLGLFSLTPQPKVPPQQIVRNYDHPQDFMRESKILFQKGWRIQHLEAHNNDFSSSSDYLVVYIKS